MKPLLLLAMADFVAQTPYGFMISSIPYRCLPILNHLAKSMGGLRTQKHRNLAKHRSFSATVAKKLSATRSELGRKRGKTSLVAFQQLKSTSLRPNLGFYHCHSVLSVP